MYKVGHESLKSRREGIRLVMVTYIIVEVLLYFDWWEFTVGCGQSGRSSSPIRWVRLGLTCSCVRQRKVRAPHVRGHLMLSNLT